MSFKTFLTEETKRFTEVQNFIFSGILNEAAADGGTITHLEHIEDYILIYGKQGFTKFKSDVGAVLDFFKNKGNLTASVKIDGAPAVFFGVNPNNGKFFVSTKTIESKNPKLVYSSADAKELYDGELAEKLATSYKHLKKVYGNDDKIYQCDLLFTADKNKQKIDGENHITFTPNTIMYAIPESSDMLYTKVDNAKIGAVVHTVYSTKSLEGENENVFIRKQENALGAKDIVTRADSINDVYITHPFHSGIEALTMDKTEQKFITDRLKKVESEVKGISTPFDKTWPKDPLNMHFRVYMNSLLRDMSGTGVFDKVRTGKASDFKFNEFLAGFFDYIRKKFGKEIDKLKTEKGKDKKRTALQEFEANIRTNASDLKKLMSAFVMMLEIKNMLVDVFFRLNGIIGKTFVHDGQGSFRATTDEGFVIIASNGPIKLVDRVEFSRNNFLNPKFAK